MPPLKPLNTHLRLNEKPDSRRQPVILIVLSFYQPGFAEIQT